MLTIATCSPDLRPRDLGADDLHHPLLLGLRGAAGQAPGGEGPARIRQAAGETHLLPGQIQDNLFAREPPLDCFKHYGMSSNTIKGTIIVCSVQSVSPSFVCCVTLKIFFSKIQNT